MKRVSIIVLILAAALVLVSLPVLAGDQCGAKSPGCSKDGSPCCKDGGSCCKGVQGAKWSAENLQDGVKITVLAEDKAMVEKLQKSPADSCAKGSAFDAPGVTRTVEKISDGLVITATSKDAGLVKKMQVCASKMTARAETDSVASASSCPEGQKKDCSAGKHTASV